MPRKIELIALLVGITSLSFEILQSKLLGFFVGKGMDVLAIPVALFGLALGSMARQYLLRGDADVLLQRLSVAVMPTCAASFLATFALSAALFPELHVTLATPSTEAAKVLVYGLTFLPPYIVFGGLLSTLFEQAADRIGALYFYDLLGAALGCIATPWIVTVAGLPASIAFVLAAGSLVVDPLPQTLARRGARWGLTVAVVAWALVGAAFREQVDTPTLARSFSDLRTSAEEVDVRWNAIARTALLTSPEQDQRYVIVQGNGLSNVQVTPWRDTPRDDAWDLIGKRSLPWRLGARPEKILVTFAGMGRDMVFFDELAGGTASITGIELNPTVVAWAHHPALAYTRLPEFLGTDRAQLLAREGRDFLNGDAEQYDLIFVANNGAVHAGRTGHTRKFLDTTEAMEAYLERLAPGGLLYFMNQPVMEKLAALQHLWAAQGRGSFRDAVFVMSDGSPTLDSLVLKPDGFSQRERAELYRAARAFDLDVILGWHQPPLRRISRVLSGQGIQRTTDDRPFTKRIQWGAFRPWPDAARAADATYVSGWAKLFTLLLFSLVAGATALTATLAGPKASRPGGLWVAYLLASGIGYMCVQIPLIAQSELLVGNPLYAISINLAAVLVCNALGARLLSGRRWGGVGLAVAITLGTLWAAWAMAMLRPALLSQPLWLKVLFILGSIAPVAMVMGAFYPACVDGLHRAGRDEAVPITYGLSTLSSVVGSALAMVLVIDLGFTAVLWLGCFLYLSSTLLLDVAGRRSTTRA